ncbi:MAG: hypothetical protein M3Z96_08855 [Pseudomonadota bacterium]|nr:hypothetical protein [Pseudomonadota bacterium]
MALQKRFNFGRAGALFNRKTVKHAFTKIVFDPTEQAAQGREGLGGAGSPSGFSRS